MHALGEWLIQQKTQRSAFAKRIGISPSHLTLVLQEKRGVSLEVAKRIKDETKGEFTPDDFDAVKRKSPDSVNEDAA